MISLRVPEGKLDEWDEKVEELGHQDRTALILTAVDNYIAKGGFEGDGMLAQKELLSQLQSSMSTLESKMDEMGEELRTIKRHTVRADPETRSLAHDILPLLPEVDEDRDPREYAEYQRPLEDYDPAEVTVPVTPDAILSWLEADPDVDYSWPLSRGDVVEALEFLEGQYLARSQDVGGETRWSKEV